jgi:two-component system, chemotaxis family, response regulator Rcp1
MNEKIINILLVEDNPADVRLAQEALDESKLFCKLHIVTNGEEAMEFLYGKGKYINAIRPDLVILDLNLPKKDGREVLKEIKEDEYLKSIPVVILTMSTSDDDALKAYNLHANCYIIKPIDFKQFTKVVQTIQEFWFTIVKLPNFENKKREK